MKMNRYYYFAILAGIAVIAIGCSRPELDSNRGPVSKSAAAGDHGREKRSIVGPEK